jgi:trimethylamine--corrinoid protein Co-methyltransferase
LPGNGGRRYRPLDDADILRIDHAALDVLETVGLADATPSGSDAMTRAGAVLTASGRLTFPRSLVEDTVARAARHFVLHGQDPRHDLEPWGSREARCGRELARRELHRKMRAALE